MNAVANSANDFIEENAGGSDSDTNSDELPEYYQPISVGVDDSDDEEEEVSDRSSNDDSSFHRLPNGYAHRVENGVSSLDLSDGEEVKSNEDEEEEEEQVSDSAMVRAVTEDENRRNAPLAAETATRVMEAMRGVSFRGLAPDWVNQVPEDQWINQLRRLRRPPTPIHKG